jgi:hypothetical protein
MCRPRTTLALLAPSGTLASMMASEENNNQSRPWPWKTVVLDWETKDLAAPHTNEGEGLLHRQSSHPLWIEKT